MGFRERGFVNMMCRHTSKQSNHPLPVCRLRSEKWMDVQVGDIIKLENNQFVTVSQNGHNVFSNPLFIPSAGPAAILVFMAFCFQLTSRLHVRGSRFL